MEQIESLIDENTTGANFQDVLDQYNYLNEFPININIATKQALQQTLFFTETQINSIISHRAIYGNIVDIDELRYLNFSRSQIQFIKPITSLHKMNNTNSKLLKNLSHQILLRNSFTVNKQKGYTETNENSYLGNKYKIYARYRVQNRRFSLGFTLEKDAGEQLFHHSPYSNHKGIDFMSGHLRIAPNNIIDEIIIGDYSLNFGQGTIFWNGFSAQKSALSLNVEKLGINAKPYTSVNEAIFLRGIMTKIKVKNFDLFLFTSHKKNDANITEVDSLNNSPKQFSSFQNSGFHRTKSELQDRKKIEQTVNGGRIVYTNNKLNLASTIALLSYNVPLTKGDKIYQRYDVEGKHLINYGVDLGYNFKRSRMFGDLAFSSNNGHAGIIGYQWNPTSNITHVIATRVLSKTYYSAFGNIFSESGRTKNEVGLYNGFEWQINNKFSSTFYTDYYKFKSPTFSSSVPSEGNDYLIQLNYNRNNNNVIYARYKYEQKTENETSESKITKSSVNKLNRFRLHFTHKPQYNITLKTRIEFFWGEQKNTPQNGYLIYQDLQYKLKKFTFTGRLAQFNTTSFSSAIYAYENDVLYSFSVPAYYYQGSKFYLIMKYKINKQIGFWIKYSEIIFDDRETIGSGLETINGNNKQSIKFQIEWKF